ncbi:hypothetical protein JCGZ_10735 [Jatropha curcas]|uniref:Uncharacterized protein n=1 Tax=Jatropha curcas TaxID=180498 RepID=A0A067LHY2_JATCU|nr:hypothetical protein JCGZ_10735 [Jatropha curcas]
MADVGEVYQRMPGDFIGMSFWPSLRKFGRHSQQSLLGLTVQRAQHKKEARCVFDKVQASYSKLGLILNI